MILQPQDQVGHYTVESLLGEGGLAEVYRVRHSALGSHHALKVLARRHPSLTERLVREGRIQAQIQHPHVVRVTDLIHHDGHVALLMEFVDGEDLESHLTRVGQVHFDCAMGLFAGVLGGVSAAHDKGVSHRDLKPANILLAPSPSGFIAKVADFGIAKIATESGATQLGAAMGTPGYAAPEQAIDSSNVDSRADIFALGALLYTMLSGRSAFADPTTGAVTLRSTVEREPVPLSTWFDGPKHICEAVHRALSKDPDHRFPDCRTFAAAVFTDHPHLREMAETTGGVPVTLDSTPKAKPTTAPTLLPSMSPEPVPSRRLQPRTGVQARRLWPFALVSMVMAVGLLGWFMTREGSALKGSSQFLVEPARSATITQQAAPPEAVAPSDILQTVRPEPAPIAPRSPPPPPTSSDTPIQPARPADEPIEPTVEPNSPELASPSPPNSMLIMPLSDAEPSQAIPPTRAPAPAVIITAKEPVEVTEIAAKAADPGPELSGTWNGTMGRARATLAMKAAPDGALSGTLSVTHVPGSAPHRESVSGQSTPDGTVRFQAGAWFFEGTATSAVLSGTFRASRGSKSQRFRFRR